MKINYQPGGKEDHREDTWVSWAVQRFDREACSGQGDMKANDLLWRSLKRAARRRGGKYIQEKQIPYLTH